VLVCIGVVDVNVDELETGVVDQAAPPGVREDAEEVLYRLSVVHPGCRRSRCIPESWQARVLRVTAHEILETLEDVSGL
jgi:hypothetical protein